MPELKELVEGINTSIATLRSEVDGVKGAVDAFDNEKQDKLVEDIVAKMETMQETQVKMQAALSRPTVEDAKAEDAKFMAEQKSQFDSFMRDTKSNGEIEIRAMSTDVNPDGGYLVRPELSNFVVDRIFETSPIRQLANVETIGTKSLEMLIDDNEAAARWVGEGASGGETSTPQIGMKEIVAHKIEADPRITQEQLQDSYLDVEAWLRDKVADKFARTENTAFVNGDGVAKPRGLLTYDAWAVAETYERNKLEQVNLGGASTLTANGLIELQNSLKEGYQARATFAMKRSTFGAALKLKGNDNYFFSPVLLRDGQMSLTLLGKNVVFMDDLPAVAANALSIVYGDFSAGYTVVDRVGLQVLRDPFTNKGFVTYYTTKRTGGDVTNFDALKIGKVAA